MLGNKALFVEGMYGQAQFAWASNETIYKSAHFG